MAVWSSLSRALFKAKCASNLVVSRFGAQNVSQIRQMSHGPSKFIIQPSRWQYEKFKDLLHFYLFVGAIPFGLISLYANLFVGPAQLAPIPEGYVPQEHEYYRHPITRFLKKYVMESEQEAYERHLHYCWQVVDEAEFRRIERDVKNLQSVRADYKYWYYLPPETRTYELGQQDSYEAENERGQNT